VAFTELHPPAETDPLLLRWLRIFAGHPWRSGIACGLLAWSLLARAPPAAERPAS